MMARLVFTVCLLALSGCERFPADPEKTLASIESRNTLRIGVIEQRPWAYGEDDAPAGLEVAVITDFAESLGVQPRWNFLSEAQAFEQLRNLELDLVIGGLTEASPRKKEAGFTRAYLRTGQAKRERHVMAVPKGENRFLTRLESFLKQHREKILQLYSEYET